MKPALRYYFIFDFYAREHDRLPGHDISGRKRLCKKRRSVIMRWWKTLPTAKRNRFIDEAERMVERWNAMLRESQAVIADHVKEIKGAILSYKNKDKALNNGKKGYFR